jgi:hypothetical protein
MNDTLFEGVVLVTGEHGTGKTTFALEAGNPNRTLFVEDDEKGAATVAQIRRDYQGLDGFTHVDFIDRIAGKRPLGIHLVGRNIIREIERGQYDVVVWDTWTRFASSCHAYVQAHRDKFRDSWPAMGRILGPMEWKEARLYEAELIAELQNKVPLVILVSHLKGQFINNVETGKRIPDVSKAVDRVCMLRLWLRHNPDPGVDTPVALVLKNFDRKVYREEIDRLRTVKLFPTKITPKPKEESLWDSLQRYWDNPAGLHEPTPDEIPNEFESSIVHGTLTEDQRLSWMAAIRQQQDAEKERERLELMEKKTEAVRLAEEEGLGFPQIALRLGVSVGEVATMLMEDE